jgi:hypothetical protein
MSRKQLREQERKQRDQERAMIEHLVRNFSHDREHLKHRVLESPIDFRGRLGKRWTTDQGGLPSF